MDAHRRPMIGFASIMNFLIALFLNQDSKSPFTYPPVSSVSENLKPVGKGVLEGVSDKSFSQFSSGESPFNWKNASLSWQRTAYHFQPKKNWMNDPNGPLFHMGWYHLFYQYNPDSPVWGNITWGHTISKDLIQWYHLPLAMVRDSSFDRNGVFTGSATLLPNGQIVMLYTGNIGSTNNPMQVQNLAYPANLSDPILLDWVKYEGNPVMVPPPKIGPGDFRDPATAWLAPDGTWRVTIGAKYKDNDTGIFLVYRTTNFTSYELLKGALHEVPNMGMWECVDFFPISTIGLNGLDTSTIGPGIKHVLKGGGINMHDYYSLGTYDWEDDRWTPDNPKEDLGFGFQVDYGTYYASKTFYDPQKQRRILWGWILEANSEDDDIKKGWASVQSIPRVVVFDNKTRTNILQWPVEEVESLRLNRIQFHGVVLRPGTVVPLNIDNATQLDITAEFEIDKEALEVTVEDNVSHDCSGGAIERGTLGPFGLLVIADQTLSEVTPIYFHIAKATDGSLKTFFCTDKTRSSKANGVDKQIYGAEVPVLEGENLSMRLLVDHSVVESFAQGGRTVITSRIYPTEAIYEAAQLFLFNNATGVNVTASLKIWQMKSLSFEDYKN